MLDRQSTETWLPDADGQPRFQVRPVPFARGGQAQIFAALDHSVSPPQPAAVQRLLPAPRVVPNVSPALWTRYEGRFVRSAEPHSRLGRDRAPQPLAVVSKDPARAPDDFWGGPYIVFELWPYRDLGAHVRGWGFDVAIARVSALLGKYFRLLGATHALGFAHRDPTLANAIPNPVGSIIELGAIDFVTTVPRDHTTHFGGGVTPVYKSREHEDWLVGRGEAAFLDHCRWDYQTVVSSLRQELLHARGEAYSDYRGAPDMYADILGPQLARYFDRVQRVGYTDSDAAIDDLRRSARAFEVDQSEVWSRDWLIELEALDLEQSSDSAPPTVASSSSRPPVTRLPSRRFEVVADDVPSGGAVSDAVALGFEPADRRLEARRTPLDPAPLRGSSGPSSVLAAEILPPSREGAVVEPAPPVRRSRVSPPQRRLPVLVAATVVALALGGVAFGQLAKTRTDAVLQVINDGFAVPISGLRPEQLDDDDRGRLLRLRDQARTARMFNPLSSRAAYALGHVERQLCALHIDVTACPDAAAHLASASARYSEVEGPAGKSQAYLLEHIAHCPLHDGYGVYYESWSRGIEAWRRSLPLMPGEEHALYHRAFGRFAQAEEDIETARRAYVTSAEVAAQVSDRPSDHFLRKNSRSLFDLYDLATGGRHEPETATHTYVQACAALAVGDRRRAVRKLGEVRELAKACKSERAAACPLPRRFVRDLVQPKINRLQWGHLPRCARWPLTGEEDRS